MIKFPKEWLVVFLHIVIVLIATGVTHAKSGFEAAMTLCAGGGLSLVTLGGVVWTTQRVIGKKPIALTGLSIVIKYALLGWIMYTLIEGFKMDILWLSLGVALILPSLFLFGLLSEKGLEEPDGDH